MTFGLHILRLASVYQMDRTAVDHEAGRFDIIGGMQTHVASLTREVARRGIDQTVLTARLSGPRRSEHPHPGVTVHRLGRPSPQLRQLWSLDAWRYSGQVEPDLVHVHQGEDVAVLPLGVDFARHHRVPLVVTVHCSMVHTMRPRGWREWAVKAAGAAVERSLLSRAAAIVTLTTTTARHLSQWTDPGRIHVIPSGVDLNLFDRQYPDPTPDAGHPRILYVGRLAFQKDVPTLLHAFALLPNPARLVVVGDGPRAVEARKLVARLGLVPRVDFLGAVPHDDVPAHMQHGDVLALPSRYEELGSVLLEAMAAALPVVATRVGGIPSAVVDGETGFLVSANDPGAMAAALDNVLRDEELRKRMGAAARRRAAAFSWKNLARRVVSLYTDVVGAFPHPRRGRTLSA